jgi:hypothetical protein
MAEFKEGLGKQAAPGALLDSGFVCRELLILISLVLADEKVVRLDDRARSLWSEHLEAEILHRLALVASILRARDDFLIDRVEQRGDAGGYGNELRAASCGTLQPEIGRPQTELLTLREACNKIMHATEVHFDVEGQDTETSFINPTIYLYGSNRGSRWRAVLDLVKYVEIGTRYSDFV